MKVIDLFSKLFAVNDFKAELLIHMEQLILADTDKV
jgi:hypothetical protein